MGRRCVNTPILGTLRHSRTPSHQPTNTHQRSRATRPGSSTRSASTPCCGSRCCRQAASAGPGMGLRPDLSLAGRPGADLPQRNRHRPQAQPALAGSGRTPPVKDIREPCAGEPRARFDGEGWKRSSRHRASPSPNQPPGCRLTFYFNCIRELRNLLVGQAPELLDAAWSQALHGADP